jgi:sugar fermentation stimulation protein A
VRFEAPLTAGRLLRRYQRFLADVELADGSRTTVHCPNTGAMLGCQTPGSPVWLSQSSNPKRRYPLTWEMVEALPGVLVGINTLRSNHLVREALDTGLLTPLRAYTRWRAEVRPEDSTSRFDFCLSAPGLPDYLLEVKNVTAAVTGSRALFPDAVSERATRHALELIRMRQRGFRTGILFCVQRTDVSEVAPADAIDPAYGQALRRAAAEGVDVYAWGATVSPDEVRLSHCLSVEL